MLDNKKKLAALMIALFGAIILLMAALAMVLDPESLPTFDFFGRESQSESSESSSEPESLPEEEEEPEEPAEPVSRAPDEMWAVTLTPGVDFATQQDQSPQEIQDQIDQALDSAVSLGMNTVVVETTGGSYAIYDTERFPTAATGEFDPMEYLSEGARSRELYLYASFSAFLEEGEEGLSAPSQVEPQDLDAFAGDLENFLSLYDVDAILLEDYFLPTSDASYAAYRQDGGAMGFEAYLGQGPSSAVSRASQLVKEADGGILFGIRTCSVWENSGAVEQGSETSAAFTALSGGNADVKGFIEEGLCDFVAVEAFGSLTDGAEPFGTVVSWWDDLASQNSIPFYVVQASSRICTEYAGWGAADQITQQIIEARKGTNYQGTMFDSLSRLEENPGGATDLMNQYLNEEVTADYILTVLAVTRPAQTTFTTDEPTVVFAGASDVNEPVTINGEAIPQDSKGFFSVTYDLEVGVNTFTIAHKTRSITYTITREMEIIREVSPAEGTINVGGDMQILVSAHAYEGAQVSATLNGQTITLTQIDTEDDDTDKDSSYKLFSGSFTAPPANSADQNLGQITVTATYEGETVSMPGATVIVNKKLPLGEGVPVMINPTNGIDAETFPADTLNDNSDPDYYPICKGALDYTVSDEMVYTYVNDDGETKTCRYYLLASGVRVYAEDLTTVSTQVGGNTISGLTVTASERYTDVILRTVQKVSYIFRYSPDAITIDFQNTETLPGDIESLTKNPLFTSATWSGAELTLTLKQTNGFLGFKAFFDDVGNLVFRFNNPPEMDGGLAGAHIVVDPGHGGKDIGAAGYNPDYNEAYFNQAIADELVDILQDWGASVTMIQTGGSPSLQERVATARSANPNLFVSIHNNSGPSSAQGTEAYYFNPFSKTLAANVSANVSQALENGNNRGGKFGRYYVTRVSQFPAILAECGFVSNSEENEKLADPDYQEAIAEAIANAIYSYYQSVGGGEVVTGTQSVGDSSQAVGGDSSGSADDSQDGEEIPVEDVVIDQGDLELEVGDLEALTYTIDPEDADNWEVTWESSDEDVAVVDEEGWVEALSEGETQITVTTEDGDYSDTITIRVLADGAEEDIPVEEVTLSEESLSLAVGETHTLTAQFSPDDASDQGVTWESSDETVVTVNSRGRLRAVGEGTATITVITDDGGYEAYGDVEVWEE